MGKIPVLEVEGGAAQGSSQARKGWKNRKNLPKFPFVPLIVLERQIWGLFPGKANRPWAVRGGNCFFLQNWSKISSLGQQLLIKAQVCVEIGKMNFPEELQGLAELHPFPNNFQRNEIPALISSPSNRTELKINPSSDTELTLKIDREKKLGFV